MNSLSSRTFAALVATLVVCAALMTPAVQAMPVDKGVPHDPAATGTPSVQTVPAPGGFDWLSAFVGAGTVAAVVVLSWAAVGMLRPHRRPAARA
jgi:hypothetical protein